MDAIGEKIGHGVPDHICHMVRPEKWDFAFFWSKSGVPKRPKWAQLRPKKGQKNTKKRPQNRPQKRDEKSTKSTPKWCRRRAKRLGERASGKAAITLAVALRRGSSNEMEYNACA